MSFWCKQIAPPSLFLFSSHRIPSIFTFFKRSSTATAAIAAAINLRTLSTTQKEQVSLYVGALLEWNQRMNLTAVTEEDEVMTRHIEDSLALIPPLKSSYLSSCCGRRAPAAADVDDVALSVVDVGSGAGLPGLIFAIACPGWKITLLESMQKRCLFLEHVIDLIGLSNVEILRERAEVHINILQPDPVVGQKAGQSLEFRELFDVAVARAVAEMRILAEYCLPLVRVGGLFVAAKGYDPQEEVRNAEKAINLLGASVLELCSVESQGPLGQRTAVICLKDRATPKKYPRHPGIPTKSPL